MLVHAESVAAFRNGLDASDSGVKAVGLSELGNELLGNGRVFGKGVFELESVVLVLLDGKGHVNEEVVDRVHERNEVGVPCVEPVGDVAELSR